MLLKAWSRSIVPTLLLLVLPALSTAEMSVDVSVNFAPPELPVYDQPPIPGEGYIWTPGYWAWGDDIQDYFWVPGTWVQAPEPEYLWTPGYWGADGVAFFWHPGYWGPHVGFYGGVNYGYGYGGEGYEGGYWRGGRMYYNRSVNNISNTNITNVYNKTVINNVSVTRVSYNGGSGGVRAQPSPGDQAAAHERHIPVTPMQSQHVQAARSNPVLRAGENQGRPPIAATSRPAAFSGPGVVQAVRGGAVHGPNAGESRGTTSGSPANQQHQPVQERQPVQQPAYQQRQPVQERQPVQQRPPVQERAPAVEQRRAPEQAQPPRPAAPPPRPQQPPPRAEPHPPEHPQTREEDRERH